MKQIRLILLFLIFPLLLFAQQNTMEYNQMRYEHFSKMKTTGTILIVGGVALNAVGIPMYIKGLKGSSDTSYFDDLGKAMGGIVFMALGDVALGGGITLVAIGNSKAKQYKDLMQIQNEKKQLSLHSTAQGLTLRLTF